MKRCEKRKWRIPGKRSSEDYALIKVVSIGQHETQRKTILKQKMFTEEELKIRDEQTDEAIRNDWLPINGDLPPMPQWNDGTYIWDEIPRYKLPK